MSYPNLEALDELDAHVTAVHRGLQAVLDLLGVDPGDRTVQAASVRALLLPLADEASQAEPLARMLAEQLRE